MVTATSERRPMSDMEKIDMESNRRVNSYQIHDDDIEENTFASEQGRHYLVRSTKGDYREYEVDLKPSDMYPHGTCDCPDFEYSVGPLGLRCKHIFAVQRLHVYEPKIEPVVEPVTVPLFTTDSDALRDTLWQAILAEYLQGTETGRIVAGERDERDQWDQSDWDNYDSDYANEQSRLVTPDRVISRLVLPAKGSTVTAMIAAAYNELHDDEELFVGTGTTFDVSANEEQSDLVLFASQVPDDDAW